MNAKHPIRYLVLWPTAACDLDCLYCYRRDRAGGRMSIETADAALDLAFASARKTGLPLHVQLAGGEPLLVPQIVEHVATRIAESGLRAQCAMQTNATRIDTEIALMLNRLKVQVGVSLDGPPDVQEQARGGAAKTLRGLTVLAREDVPVRITSVLSALNAPRLAELALTLAVFPNIRGFGLDPLVRLGSAAGRDDLAASDDQLIAGITGLYRTLGTVNARRSRPIVWRELERVKAALRRPGINQAMPEAGCEVYCHAMQGSSLAVSPTGHCYPCSQAVGDPASRAGSIDQIDWSLLETRFSNVRLQGPCQTCPLQNRCPGDCPSRIEAWARHHTREATPTSCLIYSTLAHLEEESWPPSAATRPQPASFPSSPKPPAACRAMTLSSPAPRGS